MNSKKNNNEWEYERDLLWWFNELESQESNRESMDVETLEITAIEESSMGLKIDSETSYKKGSKGEQLFFNLNAIKALKGHLSGTLVDGLKAHLRKFNGFGNLSEVFDSSKDAFKAEQKELKALLSKEEYEAARESTLTAFYTPEHIIKGMYKTLMRLGFKGGSILDPAMGSGRFFEYLPTELSSTNLYGVELDSITGNIAKSIYDNANIQVTGFENAHLQDGFFDVVVGNVPFGNFKVYDEAYKNHSLLIHDFFFVKALDKLREGGVLAFITSKGTMDKKDSAVRELISQKANLLGAIRLPNTAFKGAGAEVTTDILFLQKKDVDVAEGSDWTNTMEINGLSMNEYYFSHPEMILGEMQEVSGQFGTTYECINPEFKEGDANEAFDCIYGVINVITPTEVESEEAVVPADSTVKNFSYAIIEGTLYYREGSIMAQPKLGEKAKNRVLALISLRDKVKGIIDAQMRNCSDFELKVLQSELTEEYYAFQANYGLISSRGNSLAFQADESYFLLSSLEKVNDEGELVELADIFTKRTICNKPTPTEADSAASALAISIGIKGYVDMEYMCNISGLSEEKIIEDLFGVIFKNPRTEGFETADEYLSGNVKAKLELAKMNVESLGKSEYKINVDRLEKAQPKFLNSSEVAAKLGSHWIPAHYIEEFAVQLIECPSGYARWINVHHMEARGEWHVEGKDSWFLGNLPKSSKMYGLKERNALQLVEDILNQKTSTVYDTVYENGTSRRVVNKEATIVATGKQELIKDAFKDWVYADHDRREDLLRIYNDLYNSTAIREYDGSNILFQGMNPEINLMEHQKNGVARVLYGGNTLLAHVVGAGKTYTIIASIMEKKKLGLCNKAMIVVPNHLTAQWAAEFYRLYPSANILVTRTKDFETKNRKRFCSKIAMGNFDAVIIGHSQFERISMSEKYQREYIENEIDDIETEILRLASSDMSHSGRHITTKMLERQKKSLKVRLQKLMARDRKDNVLDFEELGVDLLCIDEAHNYKNLFFHTKMTGVAGLSTTDSQKSSDVYMKCRYLSDKTNNKGVVFATGTPVMNSIVELYTMMKYLQFDTLVDLGLEHFDSWAADFAETSTTMELAPEGTGYRSRTRFSRFDNLPELMKIFQQVADVKVADQLNLPTPEVVFETVAVEPTDFQAEQVVLLGERAEAIRKGMVDRRDDNMLSVTNDGRKLGLDGRIIDELTKDDMNSKVNTMTNNVFRIWKETAKERLTQVIFCDLSTPKTNTEHNEVFTDVYNDVRHKLEAQGVPAEEIAFIHNAKTDVQKKKLFEKVQAGTVRVLFGSTQKCGAGTNIQEKLVALHDLDCPWRPGDLDQRLGRIERQGNGNKKVYVYRYVTSSTFDAYLWQTIENKQKFISQVLTSKSPSRTCEDIDEATLSYAEIKALCVGDERIKEKMELDVEVSKLNVLKATFNANIHSLERSIRNTPTAIQENLERINHLSKDCDLFEKSKAIAAFDGIEYTNLEIALTPICKNRSALKERGSEITLGTYRGFTVSARWSFGSYELVIKGCGSYKLGLKRDAFALSQEVANLSTGMKNSIATLEERNTQLKYNLEAAKREVSQVFPYEAELKAKKERLFELDLALSVGKLAS